MIEPIAKATVLRLLPASRDSAGNGDYSAVLDCFDRLFVIQPPSAPGAFFIGGEASPKGRDWQGSEAKISVAGFGFSEAEAAAKCVGEAAELLSQFEVPEFQKCADGRGLREPVELCALFEDQPIGPPFPGTDLLTGDAIGLPRGLCLRPIRPFAYGRPTSPLGLGGGAAEDIVGATVQGLLELIERDAAALWWYGGRQARRLPAQADAVQEILENVSYARGPAPMREVVLLELASDFAVPVIAAMSCGSKGHGFACGLAAKSSTENALRSAVLEMLQMELAQDVTLRKLEERGVEALNTTDILHLQKHLGPSAVSLPQTAAAAQASSMPADPLALAGPHQLLRGVVGFLKQFDVGAYVADLTRSDLGISAVRVISAELQPEPGSRSTGRLLRALGESQFRAKQPLL